MEHKLSPELMPVLTQLQSEGLDVYAYETDSYAGEINSLFWFENGRVLNIQPTTWRRSKYNRDCFTIGVSYVPSQGNGSGCGLVDQKDEGMGLSAADLLKYRKVSTWVRGVTNYQNIEQFIKRDRPLVFHKFNSDGTFEVTK